jgi:hypothetical protein
VHLILEVLNLSRATNSLGGADFASPRIAFGSRSSITR